MAEQETYRLELTAGGKIAGAICIIWGIFGLFAAIAIGNTTNSVSGILIWIGGMILFGLTALMSPRRIDRKS